MPSPGVPPPPRLPIEDSYFELLADTLEGLDLPARGQFLQRYLRAIAHVDLHESQSVQIWDETLLRRRELSGLVGRQVSLKTALTDVLSSSGLLRVPILIEYDELKGLELNAVTDPLTGLYNRRLFAETFEKELNRARRYSQPLGLVTLDLHRFKEVNDKHGHPRGDDVLRAAAATLKKALRTSDSAFPIGGTQFAFLLPPSASLPAPSRVFAVQRKAERVSMTGTNAYAVLGEQGARRARVLDLGFGGVAMELDSPEDLPENLLAVLHVPILPPVRVNLKPVWRQQTDQGSVRVGCAFVS